MAKDELLAGSKISDDILTDADLSEQNMTMEFAGQLRAAGPWGQGFPEPLFDDQFKVVSQRIVGEKHLKLVLAKGDLLVDGIHFFFEDGLELEQDDLIHIVYKLDINEFRGNQDRKSVV